MFICSEGCEFCANPKDKKPSGGANVVSVFCCSLVTLFRIFECFFYCYMYLKTREGGSDPCHICQCALALILAVFQRNYEEIFHVMLYTGVPQTIFEYSRQI